MRSAIIVVIGLAFVALLPGCIEFEKQTIVLKLDAEKDVLNARLIYQGIYSGGEKLAGDLEELNDVATKGTRFFLFDNWPTEVDLARPEKGEKDNPLFAILRPHTTVKNGLFFLDDEGKLSSWQDIEIRNISKILTSFNRLLNLGIVTGTIDLPDDLDEETELHLKTLALEGHAWIRLDGDGLHFEFHASEEGAARLKRSFLEALAREAREDRESDDGLAAPEMAEPAVEGEEPAPPEPVTPEEDTEIPTEDGSLDDFEIILRVLSRNPLSWNHRGQEIRLTLSPDVTGQIRLRWWNEGPYVPNLLEPETEGGVAPKLPLELDRNVKLEMLLNL